MLKAGSVFEYGCAVLNDGLAILEHRDAIHEASRVYLVCFLWNKYSYITFQQFATPFTLPLQSMQEFLHVYVKNYCGAEL